MITEADFQLLLRLRENSREKVTNIASHLKLPNSTIHKRLRVLEGGVITRYVTILDFQALGFPIDVLLFVKGVDIDWLVKLPNLNWLARLENGYSVLAEVVCRSMGEFEGLRRGMPLGENGKTFHLFITEVVKKEGFLGFLEASFK